MASNKVSIASKAGAPEDDSKQDSSKPIVKVVTTPLTPKKKQSGEKFRDITEDDDGYHPFCDGPERGCDFEADPWN